MNTIPFTNKQKTEYRIAKIFVAVFAVAFLALVTATPSEAKTRRPTIDSILACVQSSDDIYCATQFGKYGSCMCCYLDGPEKGCWFCLNGWADCKWEGFTRVRRDGVTPPVLPGVLDPVRPTPRPPTYQKPGTLGGVFQRGVEGEQPAEPAEQKTAPASK
jgi:hypothetical protein